jgi:NB-ARC domain
MDIKEVLRLADELVLAKTGKHLDNLQQAVLLASYQGKRYSEIAKEYHCTEHHVANVASKLWQLIKKKLGEKVSKTTLRSAMESYEFSNSTFGNYFNFVEKSHINVCTETSHPPNSQQKSPPAQTSTEDDTQEKPRFDLRDAPDLRTFYDRASCPLSTLETLIAHENCRLLTITGMSGIGKSAIVRHLIPQLQTQFDRIIWRSLRTSPPLETTLKNLIQSLSNQNPSPAGIGEGFPVDTDSQLSMLIEYLRDNRCLIILDDVQQILNRGQISGYYKPGYENYGTLFKLIGEIPHHSCLILNSWEPPLDILSFTDDNSAVRLLQLTGLGEAATEILREKGLLDEEKWPELINFYQGNPLWLKLVAQTINTLFAGRVAQYLSYESVFLSDELTPILQQHYQRLSESEKHAIALLTHQTEPVSITTLLEYCQESKADLFKAIPSLVRRGLISTNVRRDETVFAVIPVVKEYLKMVSL